MQEIIPMLEQQWRESASPKHEVKLINIDNENVSKISALAIQAHNVVVLAFNIKMAQIMRVIRTHLKLDSRFIIQLHNQATICLWPFFEYAIGDNFRTNDIFIGTCTRDENSLRLTFKNAHIEIIPFSIPPNNPLEKNNKIRKGGYFAYVGRISTQKNLHGLLYSFWLCKKNFPDTCFKLDIFGEEDNLGSPNMDLSYPGYLSYLKGLVQNLKLEKEVRFKGFFPRKKLNSLLDNTNYTFVSASLHSDENFGMAAFRALAGGGSAILTDWGGHTDFAQSFTSSLRLIPVYQYTNGPQIDFEQFSQAIASPFIPHAGQLPSTYLQTTIVKRLEQLAVAFPHPARRMPRSLFAEHVHQNKMKIGPGLRGCRIFNHYSDPLSFPLFRAYGMKPRPHSQTATSNLSAVPWVQWRNKKLVVDDPHRGSQLYPIQRSEGSEFQSCLISGKPCSIPRSLSEVLQKRGYILPEMTRNTMH